jgi:hypothetical protein
MTGVLRNWVGEDGVDARIALCFLLEPHNEDCDIVSC